MDRLTSVLLDTFSHHYLEGLTNQSLGSKKASPSSTNRVHIFEAYGTSPSAETQSGAPVCELPGEAFEGTALFYHCVHRFKVMCAVCLRRPKRTLSSLHSRVRRRRKRIL